MIRSSVITLLLMLAAALAGCERNGAQAPIDSRDSSSIAITTASEAEKARLMAIFEVKFNSLHWGPLWLEDRLYAVPRKYLLSKSVGFRWPSREPVATQPSSDSNRKSAQSGHLAAQVIDQVEIYSFEPYPTLPASEDPRGVNVVQEAERTGNIIERPLVRSGLERLRIRRTHTAASAVPTAYEVIYYVPTEVKGPTGELPALQCTEGREQSRVGSLFQWKNNLWLVLEMRAKYCSDWPDIFVEAMRVLDELVEVK